MIHYIHRKPKYFWLLKLFFKNAKWGGEGSVVITFGDRVYSKEPLDDHTKIHEEVHTDQQGNLLGAIVWWVHYLISKKYRYEQELEAYQIQFKYIKKTKPKAEVNELHILIAKVLSSNLYGNIVNYHTAYNKLK